MKVIVDDENNILVQLNVNEKATLFNLIKNAIGFMPKTYKKNMPNWCVVCDLTNHGSTYSLAICKKLGVDPYGYKWKKEIKNEK